MAFLRRYERGRTAGGDGVVALSGVESAVGSDAGYLLFGDLVEQFGQHGSIADLAGGELYGSNFQ